MLKRLKNSVIFLAARLLIALAGRAPRPWARPVGRAIGALAHALARGERRVASSQLAAALGPAVSGRRLGILVRGVFRELAVSAVELCRLHASPAGRPAVDLPDASRRALDSALAEGRGVVFVTGHLGNWELMAIALATCGYPISTVARESYDPRFTRLIEGFRARFDVQAIYRGRPGAAAAVVRALKAGRIVGFLIDQDTRVPSVLVPFFGRPARTPVGPATLASRLAAPAVVGSIHRGSDGGHRIAIERCPVSPDAAATTARLTELLERRVRRRLSQWVWFHRRWRSCPEEREAA